MRPGQALDMANQGHSSEEELEEIISNKHSVYKRKWNDQSETSNTESDQELEEIVGGELERTPSTGSEEEESDHNHNRSGGPGSPLQFSTSPPGGVHKPRRSTSPPDGRPGQISRQVQSEEEEEEERGPIMLRTISRSSLGELEDDRADMHVNRSVSSRKRIKTSRVLHIQRPCLDLEKMQQLRTQTMNWRTGGELSLCCW